MLYILRDNSAEPNTYMVNRSHGRFTVSLWSESINDALKLTRHGWDQYIPGHYTPSDFIRLVEAPQPQLMIGEVYEVSPKG